MHLHTHDNHTSPQMSNRRAATNGESIKKKMYETTRLTRFIHGGRHPKQNITFVIQTARTRYLYPLPSDRDWHVSGVLE